MNATAPQLRSSFCARSDKSASHDDKVKRGYIYAGRNSSSLSNVHQKTDSDSGNSVCTSRGSVSARRGSLLSRGGGQTDKTVGTNHDSNAWCNTDSSRDGSHRGHHGEDRTSQNSQENGGDISANSKGGGGRPSRSNSFCSETSTLSRRSSTTSNESTHAFTRRRHVSTGSNGVEDSAVNKGTVPGSLTSMRCAVSSTSPLASPANACRKNTLWSKAKTMTKSMYI
jgi:hypothetical protein